MGKTYSTEAFLTSSVPNLQFYCFIIEFDSSNFEVYTDGADVAFCICIILFGLQREMDE